MPRKEFGVPTRSKPQKQPGVLSWKTETRLNKKGVKVDVLVTMEDGEPVDFYVFKPRKAKTARSAKESLLNPTRKPTAATSAEAKKTAGACEVGEGSSGPITMLAQTKGGCQVHEEATSAK
ncbi:hypothetical protein CONPUDRAFT_159230 [Coniophora puteana RWD-64-598 SS2]|uniref:Uncharacterized protein n=1 Tax=Coniophora puteana (strain RWD-64-598) TaxID=741705 RepID=A0A5M3M843_CONPW|nr:uncharacterized protein CONPUDRAFT_159230 [Coniophora puteana RWD-64-598 SS2]EIW75096.1 hypothetical protein CONPUDRAFT_159230 [Coniophora puteana RWD-64-598 SS2]